jgi:energy-coupling factor transporter ATP-binding protein EcfA2
MTENVESLRRPSPSPPVAEEVLRVRGLSYHYPDGQAALEQVSFSLRRGEKVGLAGPSGAGKSTLLMHLNGLLPEKLETGATRETVSIEVAGLPLLRRNLREIRRRVFLLFQDPDDQLFCPTVREDVAFGPLNLGLSKSEAARRVEESLALVGMSGYENRGTLRLSMGERKRICLAGVLACRPSILALDEPFSNLDPRARRQLARILQDFPGGQIIDTHDLDFIVELCDRVLILDQGRLRADGPTREILSNRELMEKHGLEVPLRYQLG